MRRPVDASSGVIGSVAAEAELVPTEFVAVTVQVWATSLVNPETVITDEVLVAVKVLVPSVHVASYPVMSVPPLSLTETMRIILLSS